MTFVIAKIRVTYRKENNMKKCLITEISEEDFRKLDLKVHRYEKVIISENIPGHPVVQNKMIE